jgi:hypothetical protein
MKLQTEQKADFSLGEYLRERFGFDVAVFRNAQHVIDYEATVAAFALDGDRSALFRCLLALGLTAEQTRWHAAHPGERVPCVVDARQGEQP